MYEVKKQKLYLDEEQKDDDGAPGIKKILQALSRAYASQGNAVSVICRVNGILPAAGGRECTGQ